MNYNLKNNKIYTQKDYILILFKNKLINGEYLPAFNFEENFLRNFMDSQNEACQNLWDYPLDEWEHIKENDLNVVLVDTSYKNKNGEFIEEYRFFEVPDEDDIII